MKTVNRSPALTALTQALWSNCSLYIQGGAGVRGMADIEVTAVLASMIGEIMGNYEGERLELLKEIAARNMEMGKEITKATLEKEGAEAAGVRMN